MNAIIDLGSELVIDRTQIRIPQLQMLLRAIGKPLARGSAWVVVQKQIAALYSLNRAFTSTNSSRVFAA